MQFAQTSDGRVLEAFKFNSSAEAQASAIKNGFTNQSHLLVIGEPDLGHSRIGSRMRIPLFPVTISEASLEPGSNLWYKPYCDIRSYRQGKLMWFCFHDGSWDKSKSSDTSGYVEVSLDFLLTEALFVGDRSFLTRALANALI